MQIAYAHLSTSYRTAAQARAGAVGHPLGEPPSELRRALRAQVPVGMHIYTHHRHLIRGDCLRQEPEREPQKDHKPVRRR